MMGNGKEELEMEEKTNFGKFIAKKRKEKNMTQKELADRLFVTESAVSKWERGISYPDISLVAGICEILEISEHELITSSEDYHQREVEKQAHTLRKMHKVFLWIFYIMYGISLLTCLICNLAIQHRLDWFFVVLAGELVAFSLTTVPALVKEYRLLKTAGVFWISLNLLLAVCCIYTGGDWFFVTAVPILFAFLLIFVPIFLYQAELPGWVRRHNALISMTLDTILLFVLIAESCVYAGTTQGLAKGIMIAAFSVLLPWAVMIVIRYVRINGFFKTAICLELSGLYMYVINSVIEAILEESSFRMPAVNFAIWSQDYINGNVYMIVLLSCTVLAILFTAGGIVRMLQKREEAGEA